VNRLTTTITTLLVDDEKLACEELSYLLKQFPDIEILSTAGNGLDAVRLIEDLEPDLVFLDVQMPGLDGMGVIRTLREREIPLPYFVLVTAYENYAVEAFRLEAMDYLLKPVERERLALTAERARRAIQERQQKAATAEPPLAMVAAATGRPALQRSKLLVKSNNRNFIVDAQDVIYATIETG